MKKNYSLKMQNNMKEGNKKRFRILRGEFADHLADKKFVNTRGNSKRVENRYITKAGRSVDKKETKRLINEAINN